MRSIIFAALAVLAVAQPPPRGSIVDVISNDPELFFLRDAVIAGGLVDALSGPGPFTVFAPDNQAFEALGRNILDFVLAKDNVKQLDNVLTYHVVSGAVQAADLKDGELIPTLDKENVTAHVNGADVHINNARVVRADIECTNGVIHAIDAVLVPKNFALPAKDILTVAVGVASLSTLVTAVKAANLTAALAMPNGPYTVFAPNNAAFAKLPAAELAYLLAHPAELAAIIEYHLGDRRLYADEIIQLGRLRSITGEELVTIIDATGDVLINGYSKVIAANAADCTNGVVHIVDTVIMPSAMKARAAAWAAPQLPNIVQIAQATPELSNLTALLVAAGLTGALSGAGPFTVAAPTNDAFARLPPGVINYLAGNKTLLIDLLTFHVVAGKAIQEQDIRQFLTVPALNGLNMSFFRQGRVIVIDDQARIITANVEASNGVVHLIDDVLLP